MAKDDLEDFWAAVRPKGRKKPSPKLYSKLDTITKGRAWVGLFDTEGKEFSYEGYERQPVAIPPVDSQMNAMVFPIMFPAGTVRGVVGSIGLWETKTGTTLIHQSQPLQTIHVTDSDTLSVTLTITDSPHPYGGLVNMLKMRGLL